MPEMQNPSHPPKVVLDYATPRLRKRKPRRRAKPRGQWLTLLAAMAGISLVVTESLKGLMLTRGNLIFRHPIPIVVWGVCGAVWMWQSLNWYYHRTGEADGVVPAPRWRFYQLPACMFICVLALVFNVNLRVQFFLSRAAMNTVAQQVLQTHQGMADGIIGEFVARDISPFGPDMMFRLKDHLGVAMYYSANGQPPGDWIKTRLD